MKRLTKKLPLRIAGVSIALLLSACGGGGRSAGPSTLSGNVIDGYITGAIVCLDINGNGACDSGEPSGTSGANGAYSISVPAGISTANLHLIAKVPVGAIDADSPSTPITAPYTMLSPAEMPQVISPLTTAVSTHMIANGMGIAGARIQARSDFNLPFSYDFLKDHVAANDVAAQNVAKVMAAILSNSVGSTAPTAANLSQALTEVKTYAVQATTATTVTGLVSSLGPAGGGFTRTCGTDVTKNCLSFSESTMGLDKFEGLGSATVVADPQNAVNKVAKFAKVSSGQPWAGATVYTIASNKSVTPVGFVASKTMTLRVYSSAVGEKINIKAENAADNTKFIEAFALTTKANEWETLTFDFTTPAAGTFNATTSYDKISLFPNFLTAVTADTYFDELSYAKVSGNTGTCTTSSSQNCLTSAETTLALTAFGGGASASVANDPYLATNKVVKMTKVANDPVWAGVTIATTASDNSVARAGLDTSKVVTLRVLSPAVGQKIRMKFETASDATKTIEVDATTTKANEWETLTFDFTTVAAGTAAYSSANTYNKVSVFPNFGVSPTADASYYFDELSYAAYTSGSGSGGSGGGGSGTPTALTFSSGFASAGLTIENGVVGGYGDSNLINGNCNGGGNCGGGFGANTSAATSKVYYYIQSNPAATTYQYVGLSIFAPGVSALSTSANTSGLQVTNQTGVTFKFDQNAEWASQTNHNVLVILTLGNKYTVNGNACNVQLQSVFTPTGGNTVTSYTIPFTAFTVAQNCGIGSLTPTSPVAALAANAGGPVAKFDIQGTSGGSAITAGTPALTASANTTVANGAGFFPSTVALTGPITFN